MENLDQPEELQIEAPPRSTEETQQQINMFPEVVDSLKPEEEVQLILWMKLLNCAG